MTFGGANHPTAGIPPSPTVPSGEANPSFGSDDEDGKTKVLSVQKIIAKLIFTSGAGNVIEYERDQKRDSTPLHSCLIIPELFKNKPSGAWALNCYLPDELIPGSPAAGRAAQSLADLFGDPVPKNTKPPKKGKKAK